MDDRRRSLPSLQTKTKFWKRNLEEIDESIRWFLVAQYNWNLNPIMK